MKSACVVLVQDLDWLLFKTLDVGIEIQQQKEVAFQGGFEGRHRGRSRVVDQAGKIAIVLRDDSCWHKEAPRVKPVAYTSVIIQLVTPTFGTSRNNFCRNAL
jgi:hypothetical protein